MCYKCKLSHLLFLLLRFDDFNDILHDVMRAAVISVSDCRECRFEYNAVVDTLIQIDQFQENQILKCRSFLIQKSGT